MHYGFVRIATAIPSLKVGDCKYNALQIENLIVQAEGKGVEIVCFPELSITASTCGDLFTQDLLLESAEMALIGILDFTRSLSIVSVVGLPLVCNDMVIDAAAVIQKGKILGVVPKCHIPNGRESNGQRWFASADTVGPTSIVICGQTVPVNRHLIFNTPSCRFGIEVGEDLWATIPPSSYLSLNGAELIFNISAACESVGKHDYLLSLLSQQSARCHCGYIYSGAGFGESSQDYVFGGKAFIYENGKCIAEGARFCEKEQMVVSEIDVEMLRNERRADGNFTIPQDIRFEHYVQIDTEHRGEKEWTLTRSINPTPFIPKHRLNEQCEEIFSIQSEGLVKRLVHTASKTVIIGISGGLDSTLALLVCARAFDRLGLPRKGIIGITMPGFGTTDRTYTNALNLMKELGITIREISIRKACLQHFEDIGADPNIHDVTYENSQARERTQILMDVANQMNGLVVGTGDLSELALGWATYNGDHMSMYGVNASIPKTLVKHMVRWVAQNDKNEQVRATLSDIVDTPISPELVPSDEKGDISQKTEDLVGPYELHDFFLYYTLRFGFRPTKIFFLAEQAFKGVYTVDVIKKWITTFFRRFFTQQFKRSCLPDGPMVGSCSLSPRGAWCMPSDACATAWLEECNKL